MEKDYVPELLKVFSRCISKNTLMNVMITHVARSQRDRKVLIDPRLLRNVRSSEAFLQAVRLEQVTGLRPIKVFAMYRRRLKEISAAESLFYLKDVAISMLKPRSASGFSTRTSGRN